MPEIRLVTVYNMMLTKIMVSHLNSRSTGTLLLAHLQSGNIFGRHTAAFFFLDLSNHILNADGTIWVFFTKNTLPKPFTTHVSTVYKYF